MVVASSAYLAAGCPRKSFSSVLLSTQDIEDSLDNIIAHVEILG
jgi:hypothetical protein